MESKIVNVKKKLNLIMKFKNLLPFKNGVMITYYIVNLVRKSNFAI